MTHRGKEREINLENGGIGDYQAEAISKAIKCSNVQTLHLSNNRLTKQGVASIVRNLSTEVRVLNLSNNSLQDYAKYNNIRIKSKLAREEELEAVKSKN